MSHHVLYCREMDVYQIEDDGNFSTVVSVLCAIKYYKHFKWVPAIANNNEDWENRLPSILTQQRHISLPYTMFCALIKVCQTIEDEVTLAMDQMVVQTNEE